MSENFYFDMNSETVKRMLGSHLGPADISTQVFISQKMLTYFTLAHIFQARACVFDVTTSPGDLFLVVKLEKV